MNVIHRLENPQTPFLNVIFTFIGAITLRNYLEQFSTKIPISVINDIHHSMAYISGALSLIILFHFATREAVDKIARVILPCFIILPFVPLTDMLLSFGRGYSMFYLTPKMPHGIWGSLFFFFEPFREAGVTPGQQMEIVLVILMSGLYFFIKTDKLLRSVLFAGLTYILIFFYFALPFALGAFLNVWGIPFFYSYKMMIQVYLLLILPLIQGLFYLYNKQYFTAIWKDSRLLRIVHFQLMVILGFVLTLDGSVKQSGIQLSWIFILPAIIFGGLFSIIVNNCEDYDIDKISNKSRPTISKTIPIEHYKSISWIFFGLALIYASAVNFICFFIILLVIINYFLYSSPPFRFKRIPFFSKLVISLNSLLLFGLGYSLPVGTVMPPIPGSIVLFFLVCFTAVINFIDIKDYAGDKSAGIKTLPTLLGLKRAKLIIGLFFLITYSLTYFLVQDIRLLAVMITTGLFIFMLINRKDYSEKPVFITYLFSIVFLIVCFFLKFHRFSF